MSRPERVRAQEICAQLLVRPYIAKKEHKDLLLDTDLRREVDARLRAVGLVLVDQYDSPWFGVRLADEIERDSSLSWSNNFGVDKGGIALLVVLWSKLVLPRHAATVDGNVPTTGQNTLPGIQHTVPAAAPTKAQRKAAEASRPVVSINTLKAELGNKCGGPSRLPVYLGQLRKLGFIEYSRLEHITEGPLLDLLFDGPAMTQKLTNSTLWDVLGRRTEPPYPGMTAAPHVPPDPSGAWNRGGDLSLEGLDPLPELSDADTSLDALEPVEAADEATTGPAA